LGKIFHVGVEVEKQVIPTVVAGQDECLADVDHS
jgi:hypothetical protein